MNKISALGKINQDYFNRQKNLYYSQFSNVYNKSSAIPFVDKTNSSALKSDKNKKTGQILTVAFVAAAFALALFSVTSLGMKLRNSLIKKSADSVYKKTKELLDGISKVLKNVPNSNSHKIMSENDKLEAEILDNNLLLQYDKKGKRVIRKVFFDSLTKKPTEITTSGLFGKNIVKVSDDSIEVSKGIGSLFDSFKINRYYKFKNGKPTHYATNLTLPAGSTIENGPLRAASYAEFSAGDIQKFYQGFEINESGAKSYLEKFTYDPIKRKYAYDRPVSSESDFGSEEFLNELIFTFFD